MKNVSCHTTGLAISKKANLRIVSAGLDDSLRDISQAVLSLGAKSSDRNMLETIRHGHIRRRGIYQVIITLLTVLDQPQPGINHMESRNLYRQLNNVLGARVEIDHNNVGTAL